MPMEIALFDHATIGKHEPLGSVHVNLNMLVDQDEVDLGELSIPPPHQGVLAVSLGFRPVDGEPVKRLPHRGPPAPPPPSPPPPSLLAANQLSAVGRPSTAAAANSRRVMH